MAGNNEIDINELKKEVKDELLRHGIRSGLNGEEDEEEIDLLELLKGLKKYWKKIVVFAVAVAVLVAGITLLMPNYYKAQGTIYVHSGGKGGMLSSLMSSIPMAGLLAGSVGGGAGGGYLTCLLESANMDNYIISTFGIATNPAIVGENPPEPDPDKPIFFEDIQQMLRKVVTVDNDVKTGLITISAETMSATTSAEIVTAYIDQLEKFSKGPQKEKRIFVEKQLEVVGKELETTEDEYRKFQDQYKMFALDKQTEAAIDKMALLESQRVTSNISLGMQQSLLKATGNVAELVKIEAQKVAEEAKTEAINKEIGKMESELSTLPDVAMQFLRLQRNLKVKEKVYAVLIEQYEMAKISEAEEGSQFEVIDRPRIPEKKSKPMRAKTVVMAGFGAGFLAVVLACGLEILKQRRKEEEAKAAAESIA